MFVLIHEQDRLSVEGRPLITQTHCDLVTLTLIRWPWYELDRTILKTKKRAVDVKAFESSSRRNARDRKHDHGTLADGNNHCIRPLFHSRAAPYREYSVIKGWNSRLTSVQLHYMQRRRQPT